LLSIMVAGRPVTAFSERAFWARFGRLEHERLEFKASANNLREVIPAMAMSAGGEIVLGVTDDRRLVGCPLDQPALDAVMRRAQDCGVDVRVEPLVVGAVQLTLVTVPRVTSRIVSTSDGRVLRRVGSDNVPLRGDQLSDYLRRHSRQAHRLDARIRRCVAALVRRLPASSVARRSRDELGVLLKQ
jgi:hypothetical protein